MTIISNPPLPVVFVKAIIFSRSLEVELAIVSVSSPASIRSVLAPLKRKLNTLSVLPVVLASCKIVFIAAPIATTWSNESPETANVLEDFCKISPSCSEEAA